MIRPWWNSRKTWHPLLHPQRQWFNLRGQRLSLPGAWRRGRRGKERGEERMQG